MDYFSIILISLIIFMLLKIYFDNKKPDLKCIISSYDGNRYCVRDREKINEAADLLAKATTNCKNLIKYLQNKYPNNEDVERLINKFNPNVIMETLPTSEFTAYSENKGETLAFCLNKNNKDNNQLIDLNTLTFVALHELAHIMTLEEGHKLVFWQNFKFLLENAKQANIYVPVDYKRIIKNIVQ